MPGRPIQRKAWAVFDAHEDEIFERVSNGESMKVIAGDLANVSRGMLHLWFVATPERKARRDEARKIAAEGLVEGVPEKIEKALDNPGLTSAHAMLHREQIGYDKWLAGRWNEAYRDGPQVAINLQSIGELHLNALLKYGLVEPEQIAPVHEPEQIVEAEVLAIEPAEPLAAEDEFEADPERVPVTTTYEANEAPKIVVEGRDEPTHLRRVGGRFIEVGESLLEDLQGDVPWNRPISRNRKKE